MKNKDMLEFFNAKAELSNKRFPLRLAYAIKLNYGKLMPYADAYNEQVAELKERYEIEKEQPEETKKEFGDSLKELLDTEITCELQKVSVADLERCDSEKFDSLTVSELEILDFMTEH